jgi:hypothetical protein
LIGKAGGLLHYAAGRRQLRLLTAEGPFVACKRVDGPDYCEPHGAFPSTACRQAPPDKLHRQIARVADPS